MVARPRSVFLLGSAQKVFKNLLDSPIQARGSFLFKRVGLNKSLKTEYKVKQLKEKFKSPAVFVILYLLCGFFVESTPRSDASHLDSLGIV